MVEQKVLIEELTEWIEENNRAMENVPDRKEFLSGQNAGLAGVIRLLKKSMRGTIKGN